jgi:pyruvate/2-oxoglutarate dehydrogenase complex dihydrolipoamide acyltransferase (E2) component
MTYAIKVPEAGFNIPECTVLEWKKGVGEHVEEGETVVALETDKLSVDVPAEGSGILQEIKYKEGETTPVGSVLGVISSDRAEDEQPKALETAIDSETVPLSAGIVPARQGESAGPGKTGVMGADTARGERGKWRGLSSSPAAKALAQKEGVDLTGIGSGSGPGGRIVKSDVLDYLSSSAKKGASPEAQSEKKIQLTGWRKVIAERMTRSAREVPQYFQCTEIDVTRLAETILSLKEREDLPRITYLPFVIKAIAAGIEIVPSVNALFRDDGYVIKRDLNVGVAVDLGEKLIVPVVRNAGEKPIMQIAREIGDLVGRAKSDSLESADIEGGTITVTNVGVYGIFTGIPIILQPQAVIISLGTVRESLEMNGSVVERRKKMMIGGSFDHRIVNGGPAARFLQEVKKSLEDLYLLMIKMR